MPGYSALNVAPFPVLCVSGAIGRFNNQIQATDMSGAITFTADLQQLPQPSSFIAAQVGETWHFQAWHRDTFGGAPSSNFTDGVAITFR